MEENTIIIIAGTIFTLLLIFLAAIIIINSQRKRAKLNMELQTYALKKQKEISEITLLSQESERQRIGLELHDGLGPSFVAIRINLERIQQLVDKGEVEKVKEITQNAGNTIKEAIGVFSNVSRLLYPVVLNKYGLNEALKDMMQKAEEGCNMQFELKHLYQPELSELKRLTVFRVCQELCTNAMKHSKGSKVVLELKESNGDLQILYTDDGQGFDTQGDFGGIGMNSMKGRVGSIGGSLNFESETGRGLNVNILVPVGMKDL